AGLAEDGAGAVEERAEERPADVLAIAGERHLGHEAESRVAGGRGDSAGVAGDGAQRDVKVHAEVDGDRALVRLAPHADHGAEARIADGAALRRDTRGRRALF